MPVTLVDMLNQLEALLVGASQDLPHDPAAAGERIWDARSIAAQMRVVIGPQRPATGDFPRVEGD